MLNIFQRQKPPPPQQQPTIASGGPYSSTADTANWMGHLAQHCSPTITLRDVVIPGTHDSASDSIQGLFAGMGQTQSTTVLEQLERGARYLDIRVATASSTNHKEDDNDNGDADISIWHGFLEGGSFVSVVDDIHGFLVAHPTEIVILELVPEFGRAFTGPMRRKCLDMVHTKLGDRVIRGRDAFRAIRRQSFAQLALSEKSKQRLIVILHNRMYDEEDAETTVDSLCLTVDEVTEKYGYIRRKNTIRNPWHNTRQIDQLLQKNLDLLEEFGDDRRFLLCNQCLATPGVNSGREVLGVVLTGSRSLRPVSHACQLYECGVLDCFLRDNAAQPWNIVALDFINLCPELMDFLIGLNYGTKQSAGKLHVQLAAVSDGERIQDVTVICRGAVLRNCAMFLIDPCKAFGFKQGSFKLVIAYTLLAGKHGPDKHVVAELNSHATSASDAVPILVSPFSCNAGFESVEIDSATSGLKGLVHNGQILTERPRGFSSSEHLAVSYTIDGTGCKFKLL